MVLIIIASILLILLVVGFVWSFTTTPPNLSGFYGFRYTIIGILALSAIAVMYIYGIILLI